MLCKHCKEEIIEGDLFCDNCGNPVSEEPLSQNDNEDTKEEISEDFSFPDGLTFSDLFFENNDTEEEEEISKEEAPSTQDKDPAEALMAAFLEEKKKEKAPNPNPQPSSKKGGKVAPIEIKTFSRQNQKKEEVPLEPASIKTKPLSKPSLENNEAEVSLEAQPQKVPNPKKASLKNEISPTPEKEVLQSPSVSPENQGEGVFVDEFGIEIVIEGPSEESLPEREERPKEIPPKKKSSEYTENPVDKEVLARAAHEKVNQPEKKESNFLFQSSTMLADEASAKAKLEDYRNRKKAERELREELLKNKESKVSKKKKKRDQQKTNAIMTRDIIKEDAGEKSYDNYYENIKPIDYNVKYRNTFDFKKFFMLILMSAGVVLALYLYMKFMF